MSILVQTENFSGPLGLLLHLIRREEMDIFDINIHHITTQYMDYIKAMKKLDLEMAGDFIAMAATLIQIKSRMLLPSYNEDGEEIEGEDPRKELVQKLLDYQMFQEASHKLYERPLLGRDLWARGQRLQLVQDVAEEEIVVEENALFALIRSYRTALRAMKTAVHKVAGEMKSVAERILEMRDRLVTGARTTYFKLLGDDREINNLLITFLSLLELTRMGFISIFQSENFADIHITAKKEIDGDVVSRAESFDRVESAAYEEQVNAVNEIETEDDLDFDDEPEGLHGREVMADGMEDRLNAQFDSDINLEGEEIDFSDPLIKAASDDDILEEERRILTEDALAKGLPAPTFENLKPIVGPKEIEELHYPQSPAASSAEILAAEFMAMPEEIVMEENYKGIEWVQDQVEENKVDDQSLAELTAAAIKQVDFALAEDILDFVNEDSSENVNPDEETDS